MASVPTLVATFCLLPTILMQCICAKKYCQLSPNLSGDARQCGWVPKLRKKKTCSDGLNTYSRFGCPPPIQALFDTIYGQGDHWTELQSTFNSKVLFEKPLLTCILFVNGSLPLVATMVCVLHTLCQSGSYNLWPKCACTSEAYMRQR